MEKEFWEVLTATVSHDMKTPLNSIIASTESLDKHVTSEKGTKL